MTPNSMYERDLFFELKRLTIANVRAVLEWAHKHAMKTAIDYLDCSKSFSRQSSDMAFHEVLELIDKKSAPYFRIILRKNFNWFGILSTDAHVEDVIEIGIRGITVGEKEIFIFSYLKKELFDDLEKQFKLSLIK